MAWCISKCFLFPSPVGSPREFSSNIHCENLVKLLESVGIPDYWVFLDIFSLRFVHAEPPVITIIVQVSPPSALVPVEVCSHGVLQ